MSGQLDNCGVFLSVPDLKDKYSFLTKSNFHSYTAYMVLHKCPRLAMRHFQSTHMDHTGTGATDEIIVGNQEAVCMRPGPTRRIGPPELIAEGYGSQEQKVFVHVEDLRREGSGSSNTPNGNFYQVLLF
jgi:hypothetical protein